MNNMSKRAKLKTAMNLKARTQLPAGQTKSLLFPTSKRQTFSKFIKFSCEKSRKHKTGSGVDPRIGIHVPLPFYSREMCIFCVSSRTPGSINPPCMEIENTDESSLHVRFRPKSTQNHLCPFARLILFLLLVYVCMCVETSHTESCANISSSGRMLKGICGDL